MKTLREYIDLIAEASTVPYPVRMASGKPMADPGNGRLIPIVASKLWTAITPEVITRAEGQSFNLVRIQLNGQIMQGLEGGDMHSTTGKIIVSPGDYTQLTSGADSSKFKDAQHMPSYQNDKGQRTDKDGRVLPNIQPDMTNPMMRNGPNPSFKGAQHM